MILKINHQNLLKTNFTPAQTMAEFVLPFENYNKDFIAEWQDIWPPAWAVKCCLILLVFLLEFQLCREGSPHNCSSYIAAGKQELQGPF